MSTRANLGKDRCRTPNSRPGVESWAILTLRLRVWVGGRASGGPARGRRRPPARGSGGPDTSAPGGRRARPARAAAAAPLRAGVLARVPNTSSAAVAAASTISRGPSSSSSLVGRAGSGSGAAPATSRAPSSARVGDPRADRRRPAGTARAGRGRRSTPRSTMPAAGHRRCRRSPVAGRERGDRLALDHLDASACAGSPSGPQTPATERVRRDGVAQRVLADVQRGHLRAARRRAPGATCAPSDAVDAGDARRR